MKKLLIAVTTILLLALSVSAVYAATKPDVQKDINSLYQKIADLQKQVVDKRVEGGQITSDQGNQIKDRIDAAQKYQAENGNGYGGMMGGYGGIMGGVGGGQYGCGGFYGNGNKTQNNQAAPNSSATSYNASQL